MNDALDWVTTALVTPPLTPSASPAAVVFLLLRYTLRGGEHVRGAIEAGLTRGLQTFGAERDPCERCHWVGVFADASAISEDERLVDVVERSLAQVIDDLERLVSAAYVPGEGLPDRSLEDQMRCASALLVAFGLTGRLPYSMLAEEIVQAARRGAWDGEAGRFRGDFHANCTAAQLACRLAALHRDADYAASAVVVSHATYPRDGERVLAWLAPIYQEHRYASADYGLALLDWFALNQFRTRISHP